MKVGEKRGLFLILPSTGHLKAQELSFITRFIVSHITTFFPPEKWYLHQNFQYGADAVQFQGAEIFTKQNGASKIG